MNDMKWLARDPMFSFRITITTTTSTFNPSYGIKILINVFFTLLLLDRLHFFLYTFFFGIHNYFKRERESESELWKNKTFPSTLWGVCASGLSLQIYTTFVSSLNVICAFFSVVSHSFILFFSLAFIFGSTLVLSLLALEFFLFT